MMTLQEMTVCYNNKWKKIIPPFRTTTITISHHLNGAESTMEGAESTMDGATGIDELNE
jgi:hypothetical protein